MKLAVSNIAWAPEEETEVAELLQSLGVKYIEIAPTKTWEEPIQATDDEIESYRQWWASYGIEVVAFQSMLFSHLEYKIFGSEENRLTTKKYLQDFTAIAGNMSAKRMVFGSPKNRQKGDLSRDEAFNIATDFFRDVAVSAEKNGTVFCIEPNAPQYSCDFITNTQEGIEIVRKVNHPGFGLHLDIACMALAGDDISKSIHDGADYLKHFHISAPMLEQVEDRADVNYQESATALKDINYDGFVSIEMRPGEPGSNVERVRKAVLFAQKTYA